MGRALSSTTADGTARDLVGSLERGLAVMERLAARPDGMTLTEMAAEAGLTRAGARRFLLTLVASGYASQDGRRFVLTPRLLSVARTWLDGVSLWDFALPFMRQAAEELNESCSAAILAGSDVVYVARVPGERIVSVALHVGTRLPAYCTSMGRVLLSGLPEAERRTLLAGADIRKNTERTITDLGLLEEAIVQAGRDGWSLVDGELEAGLRSLAVPVRDRSGRIVAAINVPTRSSRRAPDEMLRDFLPPLRRAAAGIEDFFVVQ